jgi:undecaprenyl diphosphate synthase
MIQHELLAPALPGGVAPAHVAIIMDGNRRWAAERGKPALEGHRQGLRALQRVTLAARDAGVANLTVYAFSADNWGRARSEVEGLFQLARLFVEREARPLVEAGVRVAIVGRRDRLPAPLLAAFDDLTARTAGGTRMRLTLAVDYSARQEIAEGVRALAAAVLRGERDPESIDEAVIGASLWTAHLPDPDLVIRTGGDLRLSDFLLYQAAYAELWATPTPWPDFDAAAFRSALAGFAKRERRFGK